MKPKKQTLDVRSISRFAMGATAALGLVAATAGVSHAHTDVELRGGYYSDVDEGFVGGGLLTSMGSGWDFNPNLEWVLVENADYMTVNGDVHYDFTRDSSAPAVWAGGGVALLHTETDGPRSVSDTDLGMNLFGGIGAKHGSVRPFFQVKGTLSDESETSLALGLRF